MCGFIGVLGHTTTTELERMAKAVARRGPDAQGRFESASFSAIHHRLAIIGPDERGTQPMHIDGLVVLFNGCIYNYQQLKNGLQADGVVFHTDTDTEVIPHLYRRFGLAVFSMLEGMFAIVLWDERDQILVMGRDSFGEKPLFVCQQQGRLGFASSQSAFEHSDWSLTPNISSVFSILTRMRSEAPQTMYEEISQLPAGCYAIARRGQTTQIRRFFFLPEPDQPLDLSPTEVVAECKKMLVASIQKRTVSDKPLGVFLSGGVDSSLITAVLQQERKNNGQPNTHTFCVRFRGGPQDYDESKYAAQVANYLGTHHQTLEVDAKAQDCLEDLAACFDLPVSNAAALPTYLISKAAKDYVDVALSGVGGDELFGGYPRYLGLAWHQRLQALPGQHMASAIFEHWGDSHSSRNLRGRARRFLQGLQASPADAYAMWTSTSQALITDIFTQQPDNQQAYPWCNGQDVAGGLAGLIHDYGPVNGSMIYDVLTYLGDDLLAMGDRMSMAHGLELRAPFLDVQLFGLLATLDPAYKVAGYPWQEKLKVMLKEISCDYLPRAMVYRPKQGFMAPIKHWLRSDFKDDIAAMISQRPLAGLVQPGFVQQQWDLHQAGHDKADILWGLLLMHRWMQQHGWDFS